MAPILVQSAEEQAHLYELFDQFLDDIKGQAVKERPPVLRWWEKVPAWVWWGLGISLFVLGAIPIVLNWIKPEKPRLEVSFVHDTRVRLGDTLHIENVSAHFDTSSCAFSWFLIDKTNPDLVEQEKQEGEGFHWDLVIDTLIASHQKEIHLICDNPASIERDTFISNLEVLCKNFPKIGKIEAPEQAGVNKIVEFKILEAEDDSLDYYWDFGDSKYSREFQPKHRYKTSGVYIVKLRIERPDQQGFCETEQSHRITIGQEKAYLAAKTLSKDPLNIILEFGEGTWLLLLLLGLGAMYFGYRWWTRKQPIVKKEANKIIPNLQLENTDKAPYTIPFRAQDSLIKVEPALYQLADVLRQRQEGVRRILDMPHTIQQTIESGGFPKVAYRRNTQPTDYLVLLDEQHTNSHLARLYDYLIDFLESCDVHITTVRYKSAFHRFWSKQYPDGITMQQLQRLYPTHRLVIIGDAHELLDPLAQKKSTLKKTLAKDFSTWKNRLLLTPQPHESWTYREGTLYELFAVFCGNIAGLQAAINYLETQNLDDEAPTPDFETWKKITAPRNPDPNTNYRKWRKPADFKDYLKDHPDLYTWFCALAVYPQPIWEITLAIGKALYPKGVRVTFDHLLILARIPVLQSGSWSPRLRKALLEDIDKETEALARNAVKQELEVIAPLVKNSHANLDVQSHLAIQRFGINPSDEDNKEVLTWMLSQKMLNKKQIFDLNGSLEKQWKAPEQRKVTKKMVTKAKPTAPDIQTYLNQKTKPTEEAPKPKRLASTSDLFPGIILTFLFLLLFAMMSWLNGTEAFYQMFFSNRPDTFVEGEDRKLNDYFFIKENVVIDSAVVYNNTAVRIWEERLKKNNEGYTSKSGSLETKDPMVWLEKAINYREKPYVLAVDNRIKLRYNLGVEKYHDYLKEMSDTTLLDFAQQDFRTAMQVDSTNEDAKHGIGLTHFYAEHMDSAEIYYNDLYLLAYFDTLSMTPNLKTLYEGHLYDLQQQEVKPKPNDPFPEFVLFKGRVQDRENRENLAKVKVSGQNIKIANSDATGFYTIRLKGDFNDGGITLKYQKEGYEDVERLVALDYKNKTLRDVQMTALPEVIPQTALKISPEDWDRIIKYHDTPPRYMWCLDNAHGKLTPGKRSPVDENGKQLFEYQLTREVVKKIIEKLDQLGIQYYNVTPEVEVGNTLSDRVARVVKLRSKLDKLYIGVHFNLGTKGEKGWDDVSGIETWYLEKNEESRPLAQIFQESLIQKTGWKNRGLKTSSYSILKNIKLRGIHTENGFLNNKTEFNQLLQDNVIQNIADAHVEAIMKIEKEGLGEVRSNNETEKASPILTIHVRNEKTKKPMRTEGIAVELFDVETSEKVIQQGGNQKQTKFSIPLELEKDYRLIISKSGLASDETTFTTKGLSASDFSMEQTIYISDVPIAQEYTPPTKPILPEMVFIKGGTFTMGCTREQGKDCYEDERPAHQVQLSDFSIGKYEVTQEQWESVMGNNPSSFKDCSKCPVENVSWDEVQDFIKKLNQLTGKKYRLPTEAEWEYAARANDNYKYAGSNNLDEVAWYDENSSGKTQPVGQKKPNGFGLYDMSGNVFEWCNDWYDKDYYQQFSKGGANNPTGAESGSYRVYRGGSWNDDAQYCRVAYRSHISPASRSDYIGFRLAHR